MSEIERNIVQNFRSTCLTDLKQKQQQLTNIKQKTLNHFQTQSQQKLQEISKILVSLQDELVNSLREKMKIIIEYQEQRIKFQISHLQRIMQDIIQSQRDHLAKMIKILEADNAGGNKILGKIASGKFQQEWKQFLDRLEGLKVNNSQLAFQKQEVQSIVDDIIQILNVHLPEPESYVEQESSIKKSVVIPNNVSKQQSKQSKFQQKEQQKQQQKYQSKNESKNKSKNQSIVQLKNQSKYQSSRIQSKNQSRVQLKNQSKVQSKYQQKNQSRFQSKYQQKNQSRFQSKYYSKIQSKNWSMNLPQNSSNVTKSRSKFIQNNSILSGVRQNLNQSKEISLKNKSLISAKQESQKQVQKSEQIQEQEYPLNDIGTIVVDQFKQTKTIKKLRKIQQKYSQKEKSPEKDVEKIAKLLIQRKKLLDQLS